jgi:hypothetical protein
MESVRPTPEGKPGSPQQLHPLPRVVLELGRHRRDVYDVLDLPGATPARLF